MKIDAAVKPKSEWLLLPWLRDEYEPCPECNADGSGGTCGSWDCDLLCVFGDCKKCSGLGWVAIV